MIRRTVVCRNKVTKPGNREPVSCGGGWWGDTVPKRCPKCGGPLTDLAPTHVTDLS